MFRPVLVLSCVLIAGAAVAQPQPQGRPRPEPLPGARIQRPPRDAADASGTAVIRGRVVTADTGAPIRRVIVRAFAPGSGEPRVASTDPEGRFELRDLPAGRWTLSATKAGFVSLNFGQRRPFEAGRPIELADGEVVSRADFVLPRGSVISGRVVDEFGEPIAGARVQALRYRVVQGERRLVPTGMGDQTDDTGAFRIYGLAPGEYYVSGVLQGSPYDAPGGTAYTPTYYPGTSNVPEAQRVSVTLGQEQSNISFALLPTRAVRVTGTVVDSSGTPVTNGFVGLAQAVDGGVTGMIGGRVRADGSFMVGNVSPGDYTLTVRTGTGPEEGEFANVPITVGIDDLSGVNIVTSRGASLSGSVVADTQSRKLDTSSLQIIAQPVRQPMMTMGFRPARVAEDGSFMLSGLAGPRRISVMGMPAAWTVKAVTLDGVDITDAPIDFRGTGETTGVQIVLTTRVTEVAGTVTDARGEPLRDFTVVIFPDDAEKWQFPSRWVRAGRPDQQGLFKITGLPPAHDYLAVAVEYLEEGEAGDPDFLRDMRDRAVRLQLAEGEVKALDLTLAER